MLDLSYIIQDMTDNKDYTRRNRFNGKSVELTKEESEIHDLVYFYEATNQWDKMLKARTSLADLILKHTWSY